MHLLFDFGGVLVDLDRARCMQSFHAIGFPVEDYLGAYKQAGIFSQLERGEITIPEFCEGIRRLGASSDATDESIIRAWESFLPGVPSERLDMLLRIRRHYPVSLLSNTNLIHWHQAERDFFRYKGLEAADFFDFIFLSCRLGVEKPDAGIFEAVTRCTALPASDILFFDDSEVNCEAARRCGMHALLAPAGSAWFRYFDADGSLTPEAIELTRKQVDK